LTGLRTATRFIVRLQVGGDEDEAKEKSITELGAGKEQEVRFDDMRLKKGRQQLTATVDSKKSVAEADEDNNEEKVTVDCRDD